MSERTVRPHAVPLGRSLAHRVFDLSVVIILSPLWVLAFLVLSMLVGVVYGQPIVFQSRRIGRAGVPLRVWKFRTLDEGNKPLGRFARFLRHTHLDEVPQLWNVVGGSMSLIGPRPLLPEDHFSLRNYRNRETLPPGLSGPWQIERNDKHDYSDMETLDSLLLEDDSLRFRVRLLAQTGALCIRLVRSHFRP